MTSNFWNERYSNPEYIYGEEPNVFFASEISKIQPGKLILPCEGEGRNAVFAATAGWDVYAFDSSEAGRAKAMQLAEKHHVQINYIIEDAQTVAYPENSADVVAFIFAHFPREMRTMMHKKAISWLKPGGRIIMEVFNPNQLSNTSGGPKDPSMLCSVDDIKQDFPDFQTILLESTRTELNEGKYHEGMADVLRYVGVNS